MTRQIALLRGINVGGHNRLGMPELKELFESIGFRNVETYLQSGNVVFETPVSGAKLANRIETAIKRQFDLNVAVVVRTASELELLVQNNPFGTTELDQTKLHITFLAEVPAPELVNSIGQHFGGRDRWQLTGAHIYLDCPSGYGRTKLTNSWFERKLKVVATTRNLRTVSNLVILAGRSV